MTKDELSEYRDGDRVRMTVDVVIGGSDPASGRHSLLVAFSSHNGTWVEDACIVSIERVRKPLPEGWRYGGKMAELIDSDGDVSVSVCWGEGGLHVYGNSVHCGVPQAVIDAVREASHE